MQISTVLFSLLLGLSIGCSRGASDNELAKSIQQKIAADSDTRDSQIRVSVEDGKVTLNGTAQSAETQRRLEQIAREEPGTKSVDDQTRPQVDASALPVEPPKRELVVIPAGTILTVRTSQALSSKSSQKGQTFLASLALPVSVGGTTALPAGATVIGKVVSAKAKGKVKGQGELDLALTSISAYSIRTNVLSNTVKGKGKRTAATTGGGAGGGALIGGLAGGGKGAAIGAAVGAGAGFVGGTLTGNKQIEIPAESVLSFTTATPLTIQPSQ